MLLALHLFGYASRNCGPATWAVGPRRGLLFFFGSALLALPCVAEGRDGVCGWRRLARGAGGDATPPRRSPRLSYPPRRCCGVGELEPSRSHRRSKEQEETTGGVRAAEPVHLVRPPSSSSSLLPPSLTQIQICVLLRCACVLRFGCCVAVSARDPIAAGCFQSLCVPRDPCRRRVCA